MRGCAERAEDRGEEGGVERGDVIGEKEKEVEEFSFFMAEIYFYLGCL